jgi:hypothetical protein
MSTTVQLPAEPSTGVITLADFFEEIGTTNPFLANRVDRPLKGVLDVPSIHQAQFQKVLDLGREAQKENRGLGIAVWGEAGVGKTHLLARLAEWARHDQQAIVVYLHNLQASADRLPRYVLKCVLNALTGNQIGPLDRTQLFWLVHRILLQALHQEGYSGGTWTYLEGAYQRFIDRLAWSDSAQGLLFDRTVFALLFRFYQAAHPSQQGKRHGLARLALRWLSGDALTPDESRALGLRAERDGKQPTGLLDNQHIKQALVALSQLARCSRQLLLLCFDQVDNLEEEQVRALSRFLHDLLDSAGNLLVVTTGVRHTLLSFLKQGVITETSWDRIGQFEVTLGRIRKPEGRALVWSRLEKVLEPFFVLPQVKAKITEDALFPLGSGWLEERLQDLPDFRPRDLITWAGQRWQGLQEELAKSGPSWLERWRGERTPPPPLPPIKQLALIDQEIDKKLAEHRSGRQQAPESIPPDESSLINLLFNLLQPCAVEGNPYSLRSVRRVPVPTTGKRSPYDLLLWRVSAGGQEVRTGARFLVAEHGKDTAIALRRLVGDPRPPGRVLLVGDARKSLPLGSKGRRRLEELEKRGPSRFLHYELPFEEYIALEALQAVIGLARSGDLEVQLAPGQTRRLTEQDVIESHHRKGRYLAQPLLRELLTERGVPQSSAPAANRTAPANLDEKDVREFVAAEVAKRSGISVEEISRRYVDYLLTKNKVRIDPAACQAALAGIVQAMQAEGLLTTIDDQGLLLAK